jgi:hypothetical protein
MPPPYSALKAEGKPFSEYARGGKPIPARLREMDEGTDSKFSEILADPRAQGLAYALRSYVDFGDINLYTDDVHSEPVADGYPGKLRAREIRDYLVPGKMGPFTNVLRR